MRELGVSGGEFVTIERSRRARRRAGLTRPVRGSGRGIVRIDGQLRQATGSHIGDRVEVEPAEVDPEGESFEAGGEPLLAGHGDGTV